MAAIRRLFRKRGSTECTEVREQSSEYLDGGLPTTVGERFRFHLQQCENCNAFVATLRATVNTLRGLPRRPVPQDLQSRIMEKTQGPPETHDNGDAPR